MASLWASESALSPTEMEAEPGGFSRPRRCSLGSPTRCRGARPGCVSSEVVAALHWGERRRSRWPAMAPVQEIRKMHAESLEHLRMCLSASGEGGRMREEGAGGSRAHAVWSPCARSAERRVSGRDARLLGSEGPRPRWHPRHHPLHVCAPARHTVSVRATRACPTRSELGRQPPLPK